MTEVLFPLDQAELSFTTASGSSVRRSILPSGVRVLTEQVPGAQSLSISYSVPVGSRDEDGVHYGSTHFLEHLLFKGTSQRSAMDIAVAFDSIGGSSNAVTAKEYTSYYARVQDKSLLVASDVIADMITSATIDPKEFETERTVILEELAMNADDPEDVAHEAFAEAVLGDHALGRPIGGTPQTIREATRAAVYEHYQSHYRAPELVVAAAGGVSHEQLIELVEKALSAGGWDLASTATPVSRRSTEPLALGREARVRVTNRPDAQANILLGGLGVANTDTRRYAMGILNTVLGGGMSSRLFQEIREKRGLAYSVYSFNQPYADASIFGLYAGCSPNKAAEVVKLLRAELERLAADGVSDAELALAKGNISGGLALKFESTQARMSRLVSAEVALGEFIDLDETLRRFESVTSSEVQLLAKELVSGLSASVAVGEVSESIFG